MTDSYGSIQKWLDSPQYQRMREQLHRENHRPLVIDRSCFKKTAEERMRISVYKWEWKRKQREEKLVAA